MKIEPAVARILVPIDYSETADRALAWAVVHARAFGAELTVLHVIPHHLHLGAIGFADEAADDGPQEERERLAAHVAAELGDGAVQFRPLVVIGDPAIKVRAVARRERIDLIVMGTHGTTRLQDLLLGSVTEKVVHHTGCPVLLVPPTSEADIA